MEEKTVKVPNISCGHCVATIKRELSDINGVESVEGDAQSKRITVRWRGPADWSEISETLDEIGYPAEEK